MHRIQKVLLLLLVLTLNVPGSQGEAQPWKCRESQVCYMAPNVDKTDHTTAKNTCEEVGGSLPCPDTQQKIEEIYSYIERKSEGYWLSLSRGATTSPWMCADGTEYHGTAWRDDHPRENATLSYMQNKTFVSTTETTQDFYVICQRDELTTLPTPVVTPMPTSPHEEQTGNGNEDDVASSPDENFIHTPNCKDESGWHMSKKTNTCYYYGIAKSYKWSQVRTECENKKAHLATPSTLVKHEDLVAYIQFRSPNLYSMNWWIGLYLPEANIRQGDGYALKNLQWIWIDNSTYDPTQMVWSSGEPAYQEKFVRIRNGKLYATQNESGAEYYICEREAETSFMPDNRNTSPTQPNITSPSVMPTDVTQAPQPSPVTAPTNATFTSTGQACGDLTGWYYHSGSNTCYQLENSNRATWQEVRQKCQQQQARLASPSDSLKYQELLKFITFRNAKTIKVWIGLHCSQNITPDEFCSSWEWVNGFFYDPQQNQWQTGEPGRGEKWVRVKDGKWLAIGDEKDAERYICTKAGKDRIVAMIPNTVPPKPNQPGTPTKVPNDGQNKRGKGNKN